METHNPRQVDPNSKSEWRCQVLGHATTFLLTSANLADACEAYPKLSNDDGLDVSYFYVEAVAGWVELFGLTMSDKCPHDFEELHLSLECAYAPGTAPFRMGSGWCSTALEGVLDLGLALHAHPTRRFESWWVEDRGEMRENLLRGWKSLRGASLRESLKRLQFRAWDRDQLQRMLYVEFRSAFHEIRASVLKPRATVDSRVSRASEGVRLSSFLGSREWAEFHGLDPESMRKGLQRYRAKHLDGWREVTERSPRQPKYLYSSECADAVRGSMRSADKVSGE